MNSQLKTEPSSQPSGDLGHVEKLQNMTTRGLISELRIATKIETYDQVEEILVARENKRKEEADNVRHLFELERLQRMEIEARLEECQKICEEKKRGVDLYEKLLANVKKDGLVDSTVEELRAKNVELEGKLKKWKGKILELNERISKLECDTELLVKEQNGEGKIGAGVGVPLEVKKEVISDEIHDHGGDSGNSIADSNVSRRKANEGLGQKKTIIEIEDSDSDDGDGEKERTSQFVTDNGKSNSAQQKSNLREEEEDVLGRIKRKYEFEGFLRRCPDQHNTIDKRSKA